MWKTLSCNQKNLCYNYPVIPRWSGVIHLSVTLCVQGVQDSWSSNCMQIIGLVTWMSGWCMSVFWICFCWMRLAFFTPTLGLPPALSVMGQQSARQTGRWKWHWRHQQDSAQQCRWKSVETMTVGSGETWGKWEERKAGRQGESCSLVKPHFERERCRL